MRSLSFLVCVALAATGAFAAPHPPCKKTDIKDIPVPMTPLKWGDWNFLSTTDTHGFQAGQGSDNGGLFGANWADWTVFVRDMKRKADEMGVELFVTDSGDIHDGSALADNVPPGLVNGEFSTPMMLKTDYDVLALGNHEMYVESVARDMYTRFGPAWNGKYLASNTYIAKTNETDANGRPTAEFVPIANKYRYFTGTKGTRVMAFGWVFNFERGRTPFARVVKMEDEVKNPWFKEALTAQPIDLIVMAGHCTLRASTSTPATSGIFPSPPNPEWVAVVNAIRAIHPTIPIVILGGHRHARDYLTFGPNTWAIASGRYMESIGFLSVSKKDGLVGRRYLKTESNRINPLNSGNVPTFNFHLGRPLDFSLGENTVIGREINGMIEAAKQATNYSVVLGCAPKDLYLNRVPSTDPNSIFTFLGQELHNVAVEGAKLRNKPPKNPAFVVVNGGGQRFDIFKGELTIADSFQAMPFLNIFRTIRDVPFSTVKLIRGAMEAVRPPRRRDLDSSIDFEIERRQAPECPYKLGYVTNDTLTGEGQPAGDDVQACPFPIFPLPSYVYSPSVLPDAKDTDLFDFVFYDFLEATVRNATAAILPNPKIEDYVDKTFSSRNIWETVTKYKADWKC
ncbi:hypothetical protein HDU96_008856 [Phlyctochytrium bullatum]|nr:hypothetical protein HDU96_008856 [Phlyctochytrium bullatum]